jgi:hypothetical protein
MKKTVLGGLRMKNKLILGSCVFMLLASIAGAQTGDF